MINTQFYEKYKSNPNGLTALQIEQNKKFGSNKLETRKPDGFWKKFFKQFSNLMVIVLLISAIVSTVVSIITKNYDDIFEGALIFLIVICNALIGVVQEKKADSALEKLAKLTSPKCKVLRDNKVHTINIEDLVVGDVVMLKIGDSVPADMILVDSNNLKVDESSLTGESHAVFKDYTANLDEKTPIQERANMCFGGTNVTYGNGKGIVIAVGKNTQMGKIAKLLATKQTKTPLEKNMEHIGKVITYGVLIIVAIVFFSQLLFSNKIDFLQAFLTAVALAVAAIPESLPAVITIIMALGVEKLAKHGAIVKNLSSVETLGSCTCIATDKTGTLTQNKMQVRHIYFDRTIFDKNFRNPKFEKLFQAISLCNNAQACSNGSFSGDATETCLMEFAKKHYDLNKNKNFVRIHEIPFDSSRKTMSTINSIDGKNYMFSKGALDFLIKKCSKIEIDGKIFDLDADEVLNLKKIHTKLADKAERILAVAYKPTSNYDEDNMILLGLVGISDPPRKEVKDSIAKCKKAGLKPIMITGDHQSTALAIAKELGIAKNQNQVITGADLDTISDKNLPKVIKEFSVFARVSPEHKTRIVAALKKSGQIVGFAGDGINDAPSIKHADIGVCMGSGTDVSKSVADIIISTDNYSTIVVAIEQGRTIFSNIQKVILFLLSTNMVEVLGIFVATIIMPNSIFLLPSQILFINLVTDSLPAFALGLEKPEIDIMNKPPRKPSSTIFSGIGWPILIQGFAQTFVVMTVFTVCLNIYGNTIASTMIFIIICIMQIVHAINCKIMRSIFKIKLFDNKVFNLSFVGLMALILLISLTPVLMTMFGLAPLNIVQWLIVIGASFSIIPIAEICKYISNHKQKFWKKSQKLIKLNKKSAKI